MNERLIEIFGLDAYRNFRKVPKNAFYNQDGFQTSYEKLFTSDVISITIISAINKNNINIEEYINEDYNYSEIYFITVELREVKKLEDINRIIQNIIPNPSIVVYIHEDKLNITAGLKRINKADKTKQVVEQYYFTGWIDYKNEDTDTKSLFINLDIKKQNFENFYKFYIDLSNKIFLYTLKDIFGEYRLIEKHKIPKLKELHEEKILIEKEISDLEKQYKNEVNLGSKAKIHMKMKEEEEKRNMLIKEMALQS